MNEAATAAKPEQRNPFHSQAKAGGLVSVEQQRAIAQVQASMLVARAMPRDRKQSLDLILQDCTDIDLAEEAEYEYSRGGSKISGPSIRLLEAVARRWGNLETGIEEISRQDGYSEFRAFAMDLETGWRDSKIFQVKHWRDTNKGGYLLTDERDIYELGANMGARRKRACMEAVIPADIIRQAADQCQLTLKTKVDVTPDLIASMVEQFSKFSITKEMIEKRIQRHITAITPGLVVQLRRIYNSLKDGMAQAGDFFDIDPGSAAPAAPAKSGVAGLKAAMGASPPAAGASAGAPGHDEVMKMIERARGVVSKEITSDADKEVALLQIEEAESMLGALSGEQLEGAKKAIAAAKEEIRTKKVGKK
jgi:hypothetical protein